MKKKLFHTTLLIVAATAIVVLGRDLPRVLGTSTAVANGNLNVQWFDEQGNEFLGNPPSAIIIEDDFKPGDEVVREIKVTNEALDALRFVAIRGTQEPLPEGAVDLAKKLEIIISENELDLYGGDSPGGDKDLDEFFEDSAAPSGIPLGSLNPGDDATYTLRVLFKPSVSDANYQGASFVFDLTVGATEISIPEACGEINFDGQILLGGEGEDDLEGTDRNDLILGFEGDDELEGKDGDDCLVGGPGEDKIKGKDGNDVIDGGSGDDQRLDGDRGDDLIFGGAGEDELEGDRGNDELHGGDNDDELDGGRGRDVLFGEGGDDEMDGGSDDDFLDGGPGDDELDGGSDTDECVNGEDLDDCEV